MLTLCRQQQQVTRSWGATCGVQHAVGRPLYLSTVQWRRSGLKSGRTNPWRALEILKNDKNLGATCISVPHCKFWGDSSPVPPWFTPMVQSLYSDINASIICTSLHSAKKFAKTSPVNTPFVPGPRLSWFPLAPRLIWLRFWPDSALIWQQLWVDSGSGLTPALVWLPHGCSPALIIYWHDLNLNDRGHVVRNPNE
jgi:hypothetical protein